MSGISTRAPTEDEVDDAVSAWHDSDSKLGLHEYLGWSWSEYVRWVSDPSQIPSRALRDVKVVKP